MTTVYFVRHAEPNYDNHDDMERELTTKGLSDRVKVTEFLEGKGISAVLSSPFKRAVQTVEDFALKNGMNIGIINDFRERKVDSCWIEDFAAFTRRQWEDFDYKLSDGECLREVQDRNISALKKVLSEYQGRSIVIGSHGTALSTIVNYYDNSFGIEQFDKIKAVMPWIVKFVFDDDGKCVQIETFDFEN